MDPGLPTFLAPRLGCQLHVFSKKETDSPRLGRAMYRTNSTSLMMSDAYGFVWKWLVPLTPMVLLIIIPFLNGNFIGNIPYFQTNPNQLSRFEVTLFQAKARAFDQSTCRDNWQPDHKTATNARGSSSCLWLKVGLVQIGWTNTNLCMLRDFFSATRQTARCSTGSTSHGFVGPLDDILWNNSHKSNAGWGLNLSMRSSTKFNESNSWVASREGLYDTGLHTTRRWRATPQSFVLACGRVDCNAGSQSPLQGLVSTWSLKSSGLNGSKEGQWILHVLHLDSWVVWKNRNPISDWYPDPPKKTATKRNNWWLKDAN